MIVTCVLLARKARSGSHSAPEEEHCPSPGARTYSSVLTDGDTEMRAEILSAQPRTGRTISSSGSPPFCFVLFFYPATPTRGLSRGLCFKVKLCQCNPGVPFSNSHSLLLIFP